jgi:RHS repeat-associated protein
MIDTATSYDANGNIVNLPDLNMEYDTKNRLTAVRSTMNGLENYSYNHQDLRVWRFSRSQETITLYWKEKRIGTYILARDPSGKLFVRLKSANIYFRNQVVRSGPNAFVSDRLGAARVWIGQNKSLRSANYLPFGEQEKGINDTDKSFDGYEKDSQTGLCYARHRYYAPAIGRFITADPYSGSAHPSKPDSWNRYAFVLNDPINKTDPSGLAPGKQNACAGSSYTGANARQNTAEAAVMNVSTATADYDNEYGGEIFENTSTGAYSFQSPQTTYSPDSVSWKYTDPPGTKAVAAYHTHTSGLTDDFSAADINQVMTSGLPYYLGAADGTFAELTVQEAYIAYAGGSKPTPGTVIGGKGTVNNGPPTTCGGSSTPKD